MKKLLLLNRSLLILVFLYCVRLTLMCSFDFSFVYEDLRTCIVTSKEEFVLVDLSNSNNFQSLRKTLSIGVRKHLPRENSALVLGLVLGINELYFLPEFRELLINTGTIHVVVASGFNISLVAVLLTKSAGTKYGVRAFFAIVVGTFLYSLITGFDPPIFRAWLMAVVTFTFNNFGRSVNSIRILIFTALVMLLLNPMYLFSLSFQLSFLATFGILYYSDLFDHIFKHTKGSFLRQDFVTTVSAQVFVLPLLLNTIGSISLLGFVVNPLTLWLIPLATMLGFVFVLSILFSTVISSILAIPLFLLTELFIILLEFFDSMGAYVLVAPENNIYLIICYLIALVLPNLIIGHSSKPSK